jgi:hypothetical protein
MAGKLILTWDISPEHEQEYFEFVVREFLPEVQQMGFEVSDAWVTVYGQQPQILVAAIMPSMQKIKETIGGEAWGTLMNKLMDFVVNFQYKVVPSNSSFQF